LRTPETFSVDLASAWRRALTELRPIVLNMPVEFQWLEVEYTRPQIAVPDGRAHLEAGPEMDKAIGIIAAARSPLVLGGRGAVVGGAEGAIVRLADRIGAPLTTTLL